MRRQSHEQSRRTGKAYSAIFFPGELCPLGSRSADGYHSALVFHPDGCDLRFSGTFYDGTVSCPRTAPLQTGQRTSSLWIRSGGIPVPYYQVYGSSGIDSCYGQYQRECHPKRRAPGQFGGYRYVRNRSLYREYTYVPLSAAYEP